MESPPQNPEFRNNPENFHPCISEEKISEQFQAKNKYLLVKHFPGTFAILLIWFNYQKLLLLLYYWR